MSQQHVFCLYLSHYCRYEHKDNSKPIFECLFSQTFGFKQIITSVNMAKIIWICAVQSFLFVCFLA